MKNKWFLLFGLWAAMLYVGCGEDENSDTEEEPEEFTEDLPSGKLNSSASPSDKLSSFLASFSSAAVSSSSAASSASVVSSSSGARISSSASCVLTKDDTTLVDSRDGKSYRVVIVNGVQWMGENLNYEEYGTCYMDYAPNCDRYGRLYLYSEAKTICPEGWHLPSSSEYGKLWEYMLEATGASEYLSNWMEDYVGSTFGWKDNLVRRDELGLAFMPAGVRYYDSTYGGLGHLANFITSDVFDGDYSQYPYRVGVQSYLKEDSTYAITMYAHFYGWGYNSAGSYKEGYSVRCVKDSSTIPSNCQKFKSGPRIIEPWPDPPQLETYTGPFGEFVDSRDGQVYGTVEIGEQTWMTRNINYAMEESPCYNNDDMYCTFLGRFYGESDADSACPDGWKIPSRAEWQTLKQYAIDYSEGQKPGIVLKSTSNWGDGFDNGKDALGFSVYPSGYYYSSSSHGYGYGAELYSEEDDGDLELVEFGFRNKEDEMIFSSTSSYSSKYGIRCIKK